MNPIKTIPEQFTWEPAIEREDFSARPSAFAVCGMGGSHLAADLIGATLPDAPLRVHADFGAPKEMAAGTLTIAVSHSGNTEETLDAARAVHAAGLPLAVISGGGALTSFAAEQSLPFIQLPHTDLPPRMATGYMMKALLKFMRLPEAAAALAHAGRSLEKPDCEDDAEETARFLASGIPIIYASHQNQALAQYFKALCNETAKTPAFANVFPELAHNELEGVLDVATAGTFRFLLLTDTQDDPRIMRRFDAFDTLARDMGGVVRRLVLEGVLWEKLATFIYTAHCTALLLAKKRGKEPFETHLVEEFKRHTS